MKGCAQPPLPRKAQPRRAALTLRLAVASRSAFRPSIEVGMPPPSKASVRCVGQAGASWPLICALGIFIGAFHPAFCPNSASARNRDAWCWVGAPGGLARMVFIMENGLWRPENAHFFPAARASYRARWLLPHLERPKSRVTPVGRSTRTLYPIKKNRLLERRRREEDKIFSFMTVMSLRPVAKRSSFLLGARSLGYLSFKQLLASSAGTLPGSPRFKWRAGTPHQPVYQAKG